MCHRGVVDETLKGPLLLADPAADASKRVDSCRPTKGRRSERRREERRASRVRYQRSVTDAVGLDRENPSLPPPRYIPGSRITNEGEDVSPNISRNLVTFLREIHERARALLRDDATLLHGAHAITRCGHLNARLAFRLPRSRHTRANRAQWKGSCACHECRV